MRQHSVLVCENQFLSREGLKSIINRHPFYEVGGEASTQEELEAKLPLKPYDLITIDVRREGNFGIKPYL